MVILIVSVLCESYLYQSCVNPKSFLLLKSCFLNIPKYPSWADFPWTKSFSAIPKSFLQVIRALAPFLHSFRCLNPLFRSIIPSQFLCPDNPSPNSCSASYPSFKFRFCGYIRCLTPVYVQVKSGMGCRAQSVILLEFRFWEREKRNKRR